jgi:acyl-coenzyme A synthetase/AMP-(fatty) acid ligase
MTQLALMPAGPADQVVAWRGGRPIHRGQLLADAARLAELLPDGRHLLNHCDDCYRFLVGLTAALVRGQVSLFPSSRAPQTLAALRAEYPGLYCLSDVPDEAAPMPVLAFPAAADAGAGDAALPVPAFPADRLAAIAFTSGSTGSPKRYPKYWGAFVREAEVAGLCLGLDRARGGRILATVPPQHMYGFITSIMLPLTFGYGLAAERPFYPEDIRCALEALPGPAVLVTTPVQLRACVLETARLPALDFILSSTAPLPGEIAARAEALFATRVLEFYGSTETGAIAARRQAETQVWRTFEDVTVSRVEAGFRVEARYFPEPQVLGDEVEVRGPREFLLHGRNTDLVKIGGKRNSLTELNRQLLAIDGVQDGAFFLPDAVDGREPRLTAFVVAPSLSRERLLDALRERVDPVFLPRPLRLVERLPRNDTGKLPRGNLLKLLQEEEAREAIG